MKLSHTKVFERQDKMMNAEMNFNAKCVSFANDACNEEKAVRPTVEQMKEMGVISEKCNCSVFTMASVAAGVLLAVGSVVYSLLAM